MRETLDFELDHNNTSRKEILRPPSENKRMKAECFLEKVMNEKKKASSPRWAHHNKGKKINSNQVPGKKVEPQRVNILGNHPLPLSLSHTHTLSLSSVKEAFDREDDSFLSC